MKLKEFENNTFKITVEELDHQKFITTLWTKNFSSEVDRDVFEFETFGGAVDKAFDILAYEMEN